jgi:hypothetical protein
MMSSISLDSVNTALTAVGIISSIALALLMMILSELKNIRKDLADQSGRIGVVETIVRLLPCQKNIPCDK